jgi:hypothetical protein
MKHGKKPNVRQAKLLTEHNLDYKEWLVIKITQEGILFKHKTDDSTVIIPEK